MIGKYSLYFAVISSLIVFLLGMFNNLLFEVVAIRTIAVFIFGYVFASFLGVITIESLLAGQEEKIKKMSKTNNVKHNDVSKAGA